MAFLACVEWQYSMDCCDGMIHALHEIDAEGTFDPTHFATVEDWETCSDDAVAQLKEYMHSITGRLHGRMMVARQSGKNYLVAAVDSDDTVLINCETLQYGTLEATPEYLLDHAVFVIFKK